MTAVTFDGQVIVGGCVSFTVIVNEHADPDVGVQVIVVVPTGKKEPDGGLQVTVPHPAPLGVVKVVNAPHWFGSLDTVMFAGQVNVQTGAAFTITTNVQIALLS